MDGGTQGMTSSNKVRSTALGVFMMLVCAFLPANPVSAETAATVETRVIVSGKALRGVSFTSPEKGWTVGTGGAMLATSDAGATWTTRSSGVTSDLLDVDFVDEQHGWAVGAGGAVLRTADGGNTWVNQPTGLLGTFNSVDFVDRQHGWIIGSDPSLVSTILATDDGGSTWTRQIAQGAAGMLDVAFVDPQRGVAVGYLGSVFRTEDGGITWVPIPMPDKADWAFYSVAVDGDTVLIGTQFGTVFRSDDGGANWTENNVMGDLAIHTVALKGGLAVAAGEGGSLALSDDAGETWTPLATTTATILRRAAIAGGRGVVVGDGGRLVTVDPRSDGVPTLDDLSNFVGNDMCDGVVEPRLVDAPPTVALDTAAADLDGDGDEEIVLATLDGLTALEPFSDPSTAELWRFPFHARVQDVAVAELDGDPGAELIGATRRSKSDRDGIFAVDGETGELLWGKQVPGGLDRVEVGDLSGDGLDDAAAIGEARAVYLIDGSNGNLLSNAKTVQGNTRDIDVGDITGDGIADVVVVTDEGQTSAIRGGDFQKIWSKTVEEGSLDQLFSVEVADADKDGTSEIAIAGYGIPKSLLPGSGDGSTTVGGQRGAYVALLNGDGTLSWDFGDAGSSYMRAVKFADLNEDGILDVLSHGSQSNGGYLYAFDGRGNAALSGAGESQVLWSGSTTQEGFTQAVGSESISLAFITDDEIPDPIVGAGNGSVFAFNGDPGTEATPLRPPAGSLLWNFQRATSVTTVDVLDFDGTSYALSLSGDGLVAILDKNTGSRVWSFGAGRDSVVSPIDHDGNNVDEIAVGSRSGTVKVTDLSGDDIPVEDIFMPGSVTAVLGVDINADGDEEVIAGDDLGNIWAIDPATGATLWSDGGLRKISSLTAGHGVLLAGMSDGEVLGLDLGSGSAMWAASLTGSAQSAAFDPEVGFVVASSGVGITPGNLATFSPEGETKQMLNLSAGQVNIGNVLGDDMPEIIVATAFSIRAYDSSLALEWSLPLPNLVASVTLADLHGDGTNSVVATSGTKIYGIEGATGLDLWEADGGTWSLLVPMDVQGDGDDEIIGATAAAGAFGLIEVGQGNQVRVLDGDGTLLGSCELVRGPHDITSADVDGDGHTEAIFGGNVGGIYVFPAPGRAPLPDPSITPTPDPTPSQGTNPSSILEILDTTARSAQFSDSATFAARLTAAPDGTPLPGREVTFLIEGPNGYRSITGLTDFSGVVSLSHTVDLRPGDFVLTASAESLNGDAGAQDSVTFEVLREDVTFETSLTGKGSDKTIHVTLRDEDDSLRGIASRLVRFYMDGEYIGTARTDQDGRASLALPGGSGRSVEAVFDGDDFYSGASAVVGT
jgi:photosystem II stability/assembly factor-like uncharacterized protein/WD40 repeat protein